MPELATILSGLKPSGPRYRLFQTAVVYFLADDGTGYFDKGVIVGYHVAYPEDLSGWWYMIAFSRIGSSPWIECPFVDHFHQDEIWTVTD